MRKKSNKVNGIWWQWSNVNQAWFVQWHDTVLRVCTDAWERDDYIKRELGVEGVR